MPTYDHVDTAELALLRACAQLNCDTDDYLEIANRDRLPLQQVLQRAMEILAEHTHSQMIWVKTWDEALTLREFSWPENASTTSLSIADIWAAAVAGQTYSVCTPDSTVVAQRVDVAGEMFGAVALRIDQSLDQTTLKSIQQLLLTWCEEVDNFLAAIARARKKHEITLMLSKALNNPVLEAGISAAIEVLQHEVQFDDLLLVYLHENDRDGDSLNYRIIKGGELLHDSFRSERLVDTNTRKQLLALVRDDDRAAPELFGMAHYREDVLINGLRAEQVVGRLLIANKHGEFNTFDRDLLERFADYVRQRVVDFNREWKVLSQTFSRDTVVRLLTEENYVERRLKPREQDVAVLFCDISGFTRLSEQVLKEPALIGQLINTWSARVVQIIWETGGVFDKMVGDCIIGLWGPPFFEMSPQQACAGAADAAIRIREYTKRLSDDLPIVAQADFPFGVATGLNYAPLFVGLFGPNDDFTGFSSGMNNTARLQGVAVRDEILCMDTFVETLEAPARFGKTRSANVKNVANALRFRALVD
jgi:adenylate cyclase